MVSKASSVAIILALLGSWLANAAASPAYHLTITREDGQRMWSLPVRPGSAVVLAYTNSIYGALTEEHLTVSQVGFTLRAVRSTSEAVLAYNGLPAPYARKDDFYVAPAQAHLPVLVVRIGQTGHQRLYVGGRLLPLYEAGEGVQVRIEITAR